MTEVRSMEGSGEREAGLNRKRLYAVLRRPLFFSIVNFFFLNTIFAFLPWNSGDILYNVVRVFIVGYSGWLICKRNIGGIRQAALVGAVMYFFDHVVLKGGIFILNYLFKPDGMGFAAFTGVVISYVFFAPLAMAIGGLGGFAALRWGERPSGTGSQA